jgi:rare lipoprotein A
MVFAKKAAMLKQVVNTWIRMAVVCLGSLLLLTPAIAIDKTKSTRGHSKTQGVASYYANKFNGRLTANGEIFSNNDMTAAHNTLPLGTYVKVTNLRNGRWVVVRITDRLHYANTRIIDLTRKAAGKLGFVTRGLTRVKIEVVSKGFVNSLSQPMWANR